MSESIHVFNSTDDETVEKEILEGVHIIRFCPNDYNHLKWMMVDSKVRLELNEHMPHIDWEKCCKFIFDSSIALMEMRAPIPQYIVSDRGINLIFPNIDDDESQRWVLRLNIYNHSLLEYNAMVDQGVNPKSWSDIKLN